MENKYITEMSKEELILPVTEEEITTAIGVRPIIRQSDSPTVRRSDSPTVR